MSQTFLAKRPHETFETFKKYIYCEYILHKQPNEPDTWQKTAMCRARRMKEHKTGQGCNDMSRT